MFKTFTCVGPNHKNTNGRKSKITENHKYLLQNLYPFTLSEKKHVRSRELLLHKNVYF